MGLRGPRAHAKGTRPGTAPRRARARRPAWEAKGLSRAERVIRFIESLKITSGAHAGRKFRLRPWQRRIIRAWYRTDRNDRRIVRTGLLTMARKQGKTTLCAALALAHLLGPEVESRGQVVAAASDRDQSGLIFDELVAFILANPDFVARTNIQRHSKIIEDLVSGSKFRALSSDAAKAHGMSPSVIIVDELAQWGTGAGRALYEALTTATGARAEPLTLVISTQTSDEHNLMSELVAYGQQVAAGSVPDPTFSAHIFTVPEHLDPWDESVWPLANPALNDFRSLPEMRTFAARAKRMPALAATFRLYYLNQRVRAEGVWIDPREWEECGTLSSPEDRVPGRRAWLGLDLAAVSDMTALAIVIPTEGEGVDVRVEYFMPAAQLEARAQEARAPLAQWVEEGRITLTGGNTTDYGFVVERLQELMAEYEVQQVGCDPWNARQLVLQLQQDGLPAVEVQQSMRNLSHAVKEFERLVLSRRLRHDRNPVLAWNLGNVIVEGDAHGNVRLNKRRASGKIDGVAATITALSCALVGQGSSVYEERPPLFVDL